MSRFSANAIFALYSILLAQSDINGHCSHTISQCGIPLTNKCGKVTWFIVIHVNNNRVGATCIKRMLFRCLSKKTQIQFVLF